MFVILFKSFLFKQNKNVNHFLTPCFIWCGAEQVLHTLNVYGGFFFHWNMTTIQFLKCLSVSSIIMKICTVSDSCSLYLFPGPGAMLSAHLPWSGAHCLYGWIQHHCHFLHAADPQLWLWAGQLWGSWQGVGCLECVVWTVWLLYTHKKEQKIISTILFSYKRCFCRLSFPFKIESAFSTGPRNQSKSGLSIKTGVLESWTIIVQLI